MRKVFFAVLCLVFVLAGCQTTPKPEWVLRDAIGWTEGVVDLREPGTGLKLDGLTTYYPSLDMAFVDIEKSPVNPIAFVRAHEMGHVLDHYNKGRGSKLFGSYGSKVAAEAFANRFGDVYLKRCPAPVKQPPLDGCMRSVLKEIDP